MKRKIIMGIVLVLIMLSAVVTFADTVSPAKYKKIDSARYLLEDGVISKYTTYYNGKNIKMNNKVYVKKANIFC